MRDAQHRWWALQDKVKSMEEQLAEAHAEVAKLKEENNTQAGRINILEKVLALRDDQLQHVARGQVRRPRPHLPRTQPRGRLWC